MAVIVDGSLIAKCWSLRHDPALLRKRMHPPVQAAQPLSASAVAGTAIQTGAFRQRLKAPVIRTSQPSA